MQANLSKAEFLEQVFSINPKKLIEWNRYRDPNEKKLFIRFIDALYSSYKTQSKLSPKPGAIPSNPSLTCQDDLLPVDELCSQDTFSPGGKASNLTSVSAWIRKNSEKDSSSTAGSGEILRSSTTGSTLTKFSMLSSSTIVTLHGLPGVYQREYCYHKRGSAANRRTWNANSLQTTSPINKTDFPSDVHKQHPFIPDPSMKMSRHIFADVINGPFVEWVMKYVSKQPYLTSQSYLNVLRGMQSLRRLGHYDTMQARHFSISEDSRLYLPPVTKPSFDRLQLYTSQIPLGIPSQYI